MYCLVVTSHPLSNSLCKLLTQHVVKQLEKMGHKVVIEDLYTQEFNPVLTASERESYYSDSYDTSLVHEHVKKNSPHGEP